MVSQLADPAHPERIAPQPTAQPAMQSTVQPVTPNRLAALDHLYIQRPRRGLLLVIAAYLLVGILFAVRTPSWQAPDEPAHYNYIGHIASTGELPILRPGDYDQEYLDLLLETQFADMLPTTPLRYESYQPPLYYLLATPIYWAFGGSLLALRLFSVLLGIIIIYLLYLCLELVFPGKTLIPLGAAAFAALLPMHVAMLASVNNDTLAEALLLAAMLVLLHWLHGKFYMTPATQTGLSDPAQNSRTTNNAEPAAVMPLRTLFAWNAKNRDQRRLLWLGVLLGLGMITKIYAYVLLPISLGIVVSVLWLRPYAQNRHTVRPRWLDRGRLRLALRAALWVAIPALLIPLPMWLRNLYLYGNWDFLALAWHDAVVVGQTRTSEFIAGHGWITYSERAFSFTFKSFWGVFGWLGVFMDERIYSALLIFTGVIFMGILWSTVRFISGGSDTDMDFFQLCVLCLFGLILAAVTLSYFWYNIKYVQHQGRYFFWGLLPISTIVALGWREILQPLQGVITGLLAAVLAGATLGAGYVAGGPDKWTVLSIGLFALVLLCQPILLANSGRYSMRRLPARVAAGLERPIMVQTFQWLRTLVWALPFLLLFLLDLLIPSIFIVPQLAR